MHLYQFALGHQPHLSFAELRTVLPEGCEYDTAGMKNGTVLVSAPAALELQPLQERLGGTVLIREFVVSVDGDPVQAIVSYLTTAVPYGKIHFSLTGAKSKQHALGAKKALKQEGRSVRYIQPKNTATILYNGLLDRESDLFLYGGGLWVTRTIQQFDTFKERDMDRPAIDVKSGMLPPKLARLMVNLTGTETARTILDPFCGSGTLLVEALSIGFATVLGSDISEKAVADSQQNTTWFRQNNNCPGGAQVVQHDSSTPFSYLGEASVDCVATEPYMGVPLHGNEKIGTLKKQADELKDLYVATLKQLRPVVKSGGSIVFIIPSFQSGEEWVQVQCEKEILALGYAPLPFQEGQRYLRYHREGQHVARDVWRFVKK